MIQLGIIKQSSGPWASPLHIVPNRDQDLYLCGRYHHLSQTNTKFTLDFSSNLNEKQVFSKMDLIRAYHRIPMASEDIENTSIITPFGLFEFLRTPFELKNDFQKVSKIHG